MPLSIDHEYILVFAQDAKRATLYGRNKGIEGYPYRDDRGRYASTDLTVGMGRDARPKQFYPITNPRTGVRYDPNPERVWRFGRETMRDIIEADLIIWPDEVSGRMERPRYKTYFDRESEKSKPVSSWIETGKTNDREVAAEEVEHDVTILTSQMNQEGGKLLQKIMGTKLFTYPKPMSLVRSLVRASTRGDDVVLDSFAGTGTTGHAVLDLNREDSGTRRFILIEMESETAADITRERLSRAISGYSHQKPKGGSATVAGLGGGFRYCTLGTTLFDESGNIQPEVTFAELAAHVYFTETGEPLPKPAKTKAPLLGVHEGAAVYLLYNGVLGDKRVNGGNVLTSPILDALPPHDGPRIIYGEGCRLGPARLKREGVVFRQIPYHIRVS